MWTWAIDADPIGFWSNSSKISSNFLLNSLSTICLITENSDVGASWHKGSRFLIKGSGKTWSDWAKLCPNFI